jgi:hypothetical protein
MPKWNARVSFSQGTSCRSGAGKRFVDFPLTMNDTDWVPTGFAGSGNHSRPIVMTKKPAVVSAPPADKETEPQRFERILSRAEFKPLKAVFDHLGADTATKVAAIITTNTYQMFLGKLGFRVIVEKQLHEQDCYTRLGPAGGIRAVVPLHDAATYSTLVTLVNYDSSVTTTQKSVDYYDDQLAEFKTQLMNRSGNAG